MENVREYVRIGVTAGAFIGAGYLGGALLGKSNLGALAGAAVYFGAREGMLGDSLKNLTIAGHSEEEKKNPETIEEMQKDMQKAVDKVDKDPQPTAKEKYELYKQANNPISGPKVTVQMPPNMPKPFNPKKDIWGGGLPFSGIPRFGPIINPIPSNILGTPNKSIFIRGRGTPI